MEIWINPECSKCSAALSVLDEAGADYTVRRYLEDPPTVAELEAVLTRLDLEPWEITRTGEPAAAQLGVATWPRDETARGRWLQALADHPELIQRPIITADDGHAVLGRTQDAVRSALPARRAVVVGVDGSKTSLVAVRWAAAEAARRSLPLRVVTSVALGDPIPVSASAAQAIEEHWLPRAQELVAKAAGQAREQAADLDVATRVHLREPAAVALLDEARTAELLVVGPRGHGGFAGLLLGSTAVALAQQTPCPLVVVREPGDVEPGPAAGQVVVGDDGSTLSAAALDYAFVEAERRGVGLTAVRAWDRPWIPGPVPAQDVLDWSAHETRARTSLQQALEPRRERHPDVSVTERVVGDRASSALLDASRGAVLLVVGSRGRGGLKAAVLGSVSHSALHHAHCPVVVIRTPA